MASDEHPVEIDSWSRTKVAKSSSGNYCWIIENFMERREQNQEEFTSEKFAISGPDDKLTWWYLGVYPRGEAEASGSVSIFLHSLNNFTVETGVVQISLLDKTNRRLKKNLLEECIFYGIGDNTCPPAAAHGAKIIRRSELAKNSNSELLPDGNLVIFCEITVLGNEQTESGSKYSFIGKQVDPTQDLLQNLSEDFERAFSDRDPTPDIRVNCGGDIFNCHEFVLSVRSPVFKAMFCSNMSESKTKTISIDDISPAAIKKMLQYIYSGKVALDEQAEQTRELLVAANKYELTNLKKVCENKLSEELELKNSIENLIFGEMYGATELMKNAMQLIVSNITSILVTEEWESFTKNHPSLVTLVMRELADKRKMSNNDENDDAM